MMIINDPRTKRSASSIGNTLKEKIIESIFLVKLRNLELASVRGLFYDELAVLKESFEKATKEEENSQLHESLIRMCWYYESTFKLAFSLSENCAKITGEVLQYAYRIEVGSGSISQQTNSDEIKRVDPELAGFLDRLNPAFAKLSCGDAEIHEGIHKIIALVESADSGDISPEELAVVEKIRGAIESVNQLVEEYLGFTDNHFAALIQ